MGYQSALTEPDDSNPDVLHGDQAILTSVRSFADEGYRIVAASPGIRADEKVDITRRLPSHGSLCDTSPTAVALFCYPMNSGRYCVSHSCYAGKEHTARGGQRVYTHLVLVDRASYRVFDCNPVSVHAALVEAISDSVTLKPPSRLDTLPLAVPSPPIVTQQKHLSIRASENELQCVGQMLSILMAGERSIVVGATRPFPMLEWAMLALPLSERERISATIGLKFSPSRQADFVLMNRDDREKLRVERTSGVQWLDVQSLPSALHSRCDRWIRLMQRWLTDNRLRHTARLTRNLNFKTQPADLDRIAAICDDIDSINDADPSALEALIRRYAAFKGNNEVERKLTDSLVQLARERASALQSTAIV